MEVKLTTDEVLNVLLSAFCNGGVTTMGYSGLELRYSRKDYREASAKLPLNSCIEDVYIQMLKDGKSFAWKDMEGSEPDAVWDLNKAIEAFKNPKAADDILAIINENDDAINGDNIFQYIAFGEIVYG